MSSTSHPGNGDSGGRSPIVIETHVALGEKIKTREEVIQLFGGRAKDVAEALGITEGAFSRWRDPLSQKYIDRVWGAAFRTGRLGLVRAVVDVEFGVTSREGE